ncbi:sugar phosphate isomerase/epimerase family protein [Armatimonas rosea]|uniref:Sugar phosphate isomerase/epimerase n=1 Tax=Armatimonas rosea TaxID=685828 RepID=A0A7W9SQP2_ARMRO|nr:sugar phosphate isomerase/epimerase [Armatimonas rosea]MBB6050680.1 sugar phosphate isomerase/epimerase [Armatimonas rosea]
MPIPFALTAYALPHVLGYLPTKDGTPNPSPLSPLGLLDAAQARGLAGVDIPLPPDLSADALHDALGERGLRLVVEGMSVLEMEDAEGYLKKAALAGARVVRFTLSGILCGDRRKLGQHEGWFIRRDALARRITELLPVAESLGLSLAFENHQDADTSDFLWLYEKTGAHPAFGVCLDAGNPLAVGEDPVVTAYRLGPLIRHIHCKDYTIHFAPEGYRLVRCAAGTGVVDFPRILEIVRCNGFPHLLPGIEIAAQATRTIPLLEVSWWAEYPERDVRTLIPALQILWAKGRPQDQPYSSAWERGESSEAVCAEEWRLVDRSVAYFGSLGLE